jgi:hypothetical protein
MMVVVHLEGELVAGIGDRLWAHWLWVMGVSMVVVMAVVVEDVIVY